MNNAPGMDGVGVATIKYFRKQAYDYTAQLRLDIDPLQGGISVFHDFGASGQAAYAMVTLATAAPGAVMGKIVGIELYAAAATTFVFTDNSVGCYSSLYTAAIGNITRSKTQLGDTGIGFTTDFTIDPNANGAMATVFWIPVYAPIE